MLIESNIPAVAEPISYGIDLPLEETFYPMGYAARIQTNSPAILSAASDLWKLYPKLSCAKAVHIRVIVLDDADETVKAPSPPRWNEHLFTIVHGPADFAIADLKAGFAVLFLSRSSVSDDPYLRYYFLEPLMYVLQAAAHFVLVHASCISLDGGAIVLCGDSGIGKTCLAYACAKRGWGFVSGDAVHVVRESSDREVIGRPFEIRFRSSAREVFPELEQFPVERRANGKADLEIDPRELGLSVSLQADARHIVFVERSDRTQLEKEDRREAICKLQETICYGDDVIREQQSQALAHFAELPISRLYYRDFDEADRALRMLLES